MEAGVHIEKAIKSPVYPFAMAGRGKAGAFVACNSCGLKYRPLHPVRVARERLIVGTVQHTSTAAFIQTGCSTFACPMKHHADDCLCQLPANALECQLPVVSQLRNAMARQPS
jgi:hypothetical protein